MLLPVIVATVLLASQAASQSPPSALRETTKPQGSTQQAQEGPANDPRGTLETPLIVKVSPTAQTDQEAAKERSKEQNDASAKRWSQGLAIATVLVGFLQLVAIGLQVRNGRRQNEIIEKQSAIMEGQRTAAEAQSGFMKDGLLEARRASDAAKASSDALKVIHRQWVDVISWEVNIAPINLDQLLQAEITVKVANRTPLPLTLTTVRCYINGSKGGFTWANVAVQPSQASRCEIFHLLTPEQAAQYKKTGRIRFILAGWIHFVDAFGDAQEQKIGVCIDVGPGGTVSVRAIADVPNNLARMAREAPWPLGEQDMPIREASK